MRDLEVLMNPNKMVKHLQKPAHEFTKYDIIKFIGDHHIEMINFRYVGEDGKLKTFNFVITSNDTCIKRGIAFKGFLKKSQVIIHQCEYFQT